jgi:hypothetical protein
VKRSSILQQNDAKYEAIHCDKLHHISEHEPYEEDDYNEIFTRCRCLIIIRTFIIKFLSAIKRKYTIVNLSPTSPKGNRKGKLMKSWIHIFPWLHTTVEDLGSQYLAKCYLRKSTVSWNSLDLEYIKLTSIILIDKNKHSQQLLSPEFRTSQCYMHTNKFSGFILKSCSQDYQRNFQNFDIDLITLILYQKLHCSVSTSPPEGDQPRRITHHE